MTVSADAPSAARMFELVWSTLVGVLGTAATATLFRRAVKNIAHDELEEPPLSGFEIVRDGMDYRFVLPSSWRDRSEETVRALERLVWDELCPLLEELTGPAVIRMLRRHPELVRGGVASERGART